MCLLTILRKNWMAINLMEVSGWVENDTLNFCFDSEAFQFQMDPGIFS